MNDSGNQKCRFFKVKKKKQHQKKTKKKTAVSMHAQKQHRETHGGGKGREREWEKMNNIEKNRNIIELFLDMTLNKICILLSSHNISEGYLHTGIQSDSGLCF